MVGLLLLRVANRSVRADSSGLPGMEWAFSVLITTRRWLLYFIMNLIPYNS